MEVIIKVPGVWGGMVVHVAGKPSIEETLPEHVLANTYVVNKPCPEQIVDDRILAAQAERTTLHTDPEKTKLAEYKLAKKIATSLNKEHYLERLYAHAEQQKKQQNDFDSAVGTFNSYNEGNELIVKDYYYDCGSASRRILERSIAILDLLFTEFNVTHSDSKQGIYIMATHCYPEFNPILNVFGTTMSRVTSALPDFCGTLLAILGLHKISESMGTSSAMSSDESNKPVESQLSPRRID